ncbi:MAG TPA: methyltransferase domain-containing protein, partial [Planctomycetota bacterium]|nr:methyltransferase domain-containing protein [Planctomycetota bacterium]
MKGPELRKAVRKKYGKAAMVAKSGGKAGCCGESCCGGSGSVLGPVTRDLYDARETAPFPREAVLASLGCGNPAALARLEAGEVVLDLGSGGGLDVLLAAERVGSTGKVYGLDMTDRMLALARENLRKTGMRNV